MIPPCTPEGQQIVDTFGPLWIEEDGDFRILLADGDLGNGSGEPVGLYEDSPLWGIVQGYVVHI